MPRHTSNPHAILPPGRVALKRAFLLFLVVAGLILMSMSKSGNPAALRLRAAVLDVVTPVVSFVASPFDAMASAGEWVVSAVHTHAENIALKNQNVQLLQWQATAQQLEAENQSLRRLMHAVPIQKYHYVTARLVTDFGGPFARSAVLAGGAAAGIKKDQPVINENGLVGRVMEAGQHSARVLLLADANSRVPVISERTREKSMLSGTGGALPVLHYLPANHQMETGDRLVTSGDGGIFPPGLPVGVISRIKDGDITVQPFADLSRVEYVSAVEYNF